jgi:DNA ligase-associated metallophosphoesterase
VLNNANLVKGVVIAAEAPAYELIRAMASDNFRARIMPATAASRVAIGSNVLLDGRLALFHETQKWLAVADLHFGYELSQRAAGRLFPLWGMTSIEARLVELLDEYQPRRLIILGDLVHDAASATAASEFLDRLRQNCEVIALTGNHDRPVESTIEFVPRWETPTFLFQHGDCPPEATDRTRIIGHHHPAATIRDGAGLRLKFPALIQQERCWILPAFSPWAGGVCWPDDGRCRIWLCSPGRVLRL